MAFLELENISKYFGRNVAVEHINLSVERGEFLTLLGPSGCGKTTILRMIAGFEIPSEGNILLDEEDITNRAASKRPMGMVFQAYALFPHMTAAQNIAFGLSIQRKPKDYIKRRCAELLELVGLSDKGGSFPHQLSGGQQQRVALARALAVEPKVLLLDEPLSALDAKVRVSLRNEIRHVQQQLKMTAIYVTHDQEEALAISDRIAVMAKGHIEQLDHPEEIYSNPRTVFAASFVGNSNQFRGILESARDGLFQTDDFLLRVPPQQGVKDGQQAMVLVRPEEMSISPAPEGEASSENSTDNHSIGVIELRTFLGPFTRFHIHVNDHLTLTADIPNQQSRDYFVAQHVTLSFSPDACQVLPLAAEESSLVRLAERERSNSPISSYAER
jgi:putative spermidine/putrescine transport system ATP-binding protein